MSSRGSLASIASTDLDRDSDSVAFPYESYALYVRWPCLCGFWLRQDQEEERRARRKRRGKRDWLGTCLLTVLVVCGATGAVLMVLHVMDSSPVLYFFFICTYVCVYLVLYMAVAAFALCCSKCLVWFQATPSTETDSLDQPLADAAPPTAPSVQERV